MSQAQVRIDPTTLGAELPSALFGAFVEHLGRAVYDGIYEPGHPSAGADGFREDVLELIRDLGPTQVRYPGGNFVSGYSWEDGVGRDRPVRLDAAWHSIEPNTVGLHKFAAWAERAGLELVEAVNLGTRGMQEAAALVEYANHPGGTTRSEQRRAHGRAEPFGIRIWCLGNEMDGPWQIGHKTADEYGRLAAETARLMRLVDPDIELVVAGSSAHDLPTFGDWERTVLRHTIGLIDHISLHAYYEERDGDTIGFLASGQRLEEQICAVAAIIDQVAAETGQPAPRIAVDEWNVWRMSEQVDSQVGGHRVEAPRHHDPRPAPPGRLVKAVDDIGDEEDLPGQVGIVGAGLGARLHERYAVAQVGPDRAHHFTGRAGQAAHVGCPACLVGAAWSGEPRPPQRGTTACNP